MTNGHDPVRWWVFDDRVEPQWRVDSVPPPEWPGWEARYDNDVERGKRTTRRPDDLPNRLSYTLGETLLAEGSGKSGGIYDGIRPADCWSRVLGYPVEFDGSLHGGGLHVMAPGAHLGVHLDYDLHPRVPGRRRALNVIAFLHREWRPGWGGSLVLCDPMGGAVTRIAPLPGRVVAFECSDLSYHGVEAVTGPAERVSLALYFLADAGPHNTRRRALFVPPR